METVVFRVWPAIIIVKQTCNLDKERECTNLMSTFFFLYGTSYSPPSCILCHWSSRCSVLHRPALSVLLVRKEMPVPCFSPVQWQRSAQAGDNGEQKGHCCVTQILCWCLSSVLCSGQYCLTSAGDKASISGLCEKGIFKGHLFPMLCSKREHLAAWAHLRKYQLIAIAWIDHQLGYKIIMIAKLMQTSKMSTE